MTGTSGLDTSDDNFSNLAFEKKQLEARRQPLGVLALRGSLHSAHFQIEVGVGQSPKHRPSGLGINTASQWTVFAEGPSEPI